MSVITQRPHVVIIGGGFGGLAAAQALADAPVAITLIDRRNHHLFQPLLYQVATAALNPGDIAYPIRAALASQRNVRVLLATASEIDVAGRRVVLDDGELFYDYLIVATGATHSYFGRDDWATAAPGLKTVEDALEIRRRIFLAYEAAERESDPVAQREWLTFAVVGAGPTGVELAGALGEIGLQTLAHDFRTIDPTQVRVVLFEGRDRILGAYPPKLSKAGQEALEKRHVEVRLNTRVTAIDATGVKVSANGRDEHIGARTVLWAAGVAGSPLAATLGAPRDPSGRVEVLPDLSIPDHAEVFVIGDLAKMVMADGSQVPGVAQGAIQGGKFVAGVIEDEVRAEWTPARREASASGRGGNSETRGAPNAMVRGKAKPRPAFRYHDKGNMATIGRAEAVIATKRFARSGLLAWLLWWAIHIVFLVGFRNRFLMMFHWVWQWVTFKRGARLITGKIGPLPAIRAIGRDGQVALPSAATPVALIATPPVAPLPAPVGKDTTEASSA